MKKNLLIVLVAITVLSLSLQAHAQYTKRDTSKLQTGMTIEEVRSILGRPNEINTRSGPGGETQQWVYLEGRGRFLFVYFKNGRYTGQYSRYGERPKRLP